MKIIKNKNESFEEFFKRFKLKLKKSNIIEEYKKRRYFNKKLR
ncbi:30S ribosomal protein S21 [Candidatus Vidania fulgoroideorum]